jgi:GNAT superfamily N-acetyltransferase
MSASANPANSAAAMPIRVAAAGDVDPLTRLINAAFAVERVAFEGDRTNPDGVRELMAKGVFLLAHPQRQGTGLGRRLMAAAEEHARSLGCRGIDLRVISPRPELVPFYRHLGYSETGTAPFTSDTPTKVPVHYILMGKSVA